MSQSNETQDSKTSAAAAGPWRVGERPQPHSMLPIRGADNKIVGYVARRRDEQANASVMAASPEMADELLWIRENLHPRALGRPATDTELVAITRATRALRHAGVIPTPVLAEADA